MAIALLLGMTVTASGGAYAWITTTTEQAQEQASQGLSQQVRVRAVQCRDATATVALSNTGDAELVTDTATASLYRGDELASTVERDVSGRDVLTPGGFSEIHFPFTAFIEPGVGYQLRVTFDDAGVSVERGCTGSSGSLTGYWPLDTISSGNVSDLTGGVEGDVMNGASETAGQVDGALLFDGTDDYVDVTAPYWNGLFNRTRFTIVAWVRPENMTGGYQNGAAGVFVGQRYGTSMALGYWGSGTVFLNMDDTRSDSPSSDDAVTGGTWHHVAAVADWSTQNVTFYVDGSESGPKSWGDSNIIDSDDLFLGRDARFDMYFDGALDDVRVYDDTLPGDRIQAIYNATR